MPSAANIPSSDFGEMPNSCFMAAALTKSCVIIWGEYFVKIKNDSGIMEWWNDGTMGRSNRDEKSKLEYN